MGDVEEAHITREATTASMKKKQQDAVMEMNEQCEQLAKMKTKVEQDKMKILAEVGDVRAATDEVNRSKASAEKSYRNLLNNLNDLNKKVEEANLHLGDLEALKRRLTAENADVLRQLQELQNNASLLAKTRSGLASSLEEAKNVCDHEAKERVSLLGKYRNLEHELDGLKQGHDEEVGAKENVMRQCMKAQGDANMWRQKYEIEGMAKAEELAMAQLKLQARLSESQNMIDQLQMKLSQLEKNKAKLQADAQEMTVQLDQAQILNANMEKKAKQCDRIVGEWKGKVDRLSFDLDCSQNETRGVSSELFKVKNAYDEALLQLEEVRRENKTLSNEIKDILDQITEGGRSIHEIDKIRKRLEAEKLETDVVDLGVALEHANAANAESQRNIKRIQATIREVQAKYEDEVRAKSAAQDALIAAERRVNANQNALEEARTLLEQSDRNRRMIEQELADTNETLSQQTCTNQAINGAKSKCASG